MHIIANLWFNCDTVAPLSAVWSGNCSKSGESAGTRAAGCAIHVLTALRTTIQSAAAAAERCFALWQRHVDGRLVRGTRANSATRRTESPATGARQQQSTCHVQLSAVLPMPPQRALNAAVHCVPWSQNGGSVSRQRQGIKNQAPIGTLDNQFGCRHSCCRRLVSVDSMTSLSFYKEQNNLSRR